MIRPAATSLGQLLISVGISRLMDAPYRHISVVASPNHASDNAWYDAELSFLMREQAKRFANLGQ